MIFIDEPCPVKIVDYEQCIEQMTRKLASVPGVLAVYQIGGLSAPGISDIDMVAIFEDGASCNIDPRLNQSEISKYLFVHPLFATSRSLFEESRRFTFFHNFRLLHGEELRPSEPHQNSDEDSIMKRQLAREFLVRMLVNMTVEREYGIYKLRAMLLQGKALLYDLEFLEVEPLPLLECLHQIICWRENWFSNHPNNREVEYFYNKFWAALTAFLGNHLGDNPLYLPKRSKYLVGRNIEIRPGAQVGGKSVGLKLAWVPNRFARKLISIQHRLNRITITAPIQTLDVPERVEKSFEYNARALAYNHRHLPHFMPLTSSLIFRS